MSVRHIKAMLGVWLRETRRRHRPIVISKLGFDIVHGCQLRCVGCPNSVTEPEIRFATRDVFRACLANLDVESISAFRLFNFGEPLLHPDIAGLMEELRPLRAKIKRIEISTNAQHPNLNKLESALKTGLLDSLAVSCDGDGTPEEYERLRPPAKWSRLVEFLRGAKELRDRLSPATVLLTRTISETEEGRQRWRSLVEPLGWKPQFRGWLELPGSKRTQATAPSDRTLGRGVCPYQAEKTYCYVDSDGTVVPCCVHPRAFVLGDLKTQRFSKILFGEPRQKLLRGLAQGRQSLPICCQCSV